MIPAFFLPLPGLLSVRSLSGFLWVAVQPGVSIGSYRCWLPENALVDAGGQVLLYMLPLVCQATPNPGLRAVCRAHQLLKCINPFHLRYSLSLKSISGKLQLAISPTTPSINITVK